MGAPGAFVDAAALASRLARWRVCYDGRPLFRAAAGPRWVRLHLAGDEHFCLLLTTVPGATQLVGLHGRLPEALTAAMHAERDHPLPAALAGTTLTGLAALPNERVACLRFTRPDGSPLHLLHQLFGSPGNTVLLDGGGRCLWAAHRPPNALLAVAPGRSLYAEAARAPGDAPAVSGQPDEDEAETDAALEHLAATLAEELHGRATVALDRRLRAASRLCERRTADLAGAGAGDEHRRRAEALAASLHTIRQGASSCDVTDPRDGARVTIELDPAQGPAANLAALFHRARKADRGREVIAAKLAEAQAETDALRSALDGLAALPSGAGGLQRLAALQEWLAGRSDLARDGGSRAGTARRSGAVEEPSRPFRRYLIDGRWEVWLGRSSRENDELTHGAAHSRDLWLHVHGATGSHVVIRTGGRPELVPRGVLEKAAALAALHSKARNASLVPVVWTEKRYVRKPRKSPPGLAVTLQAQTVMVAPGIVAGVEPA
jgi:predicted ribosome quality control (RQC) complex YloA/Tae2 family protein